MPATLPKFANAMMGRHLGRRPVTDERRRKTLPLRPFLKLAGRVIPDHDDYATKAQKSLTQMMGNDQEGDCAAVDLLKRLGMINAYRPGGADITATTAEALKWYHQIGGPGDNGLFMPDAYDWWRDKGVMVSGKLHRIDGYAQFDVTDVATFNAAFHWFGGVDLGVALTRTQYMHAEDGDTWDIDGSPVVGGHAIPLTTRDVEKCQLATWAKQPHATRRLIHSRAWADEAYVVISRESIGPDGLDTNNVNWDALAPALAAVAAGGTPDIPDDPTPPVPPVPPVPPGPPGDLTLDGWVEVFSQRLPIHLSGKISSALAAVGPGQYIVLALDLLALFADVRAKNWTQFAIDLEKLLNDAGGLFTANDVLQIGRALTTHAELLPLLSPYVPTRT